MTKPTVVATKTFLVYSFGKKLGTVEAVSRPDAWEKAAEAFGEDVTWVKEIR